MKGEYLDLVTWSTCKEHVKCCIVKHWSRMRTNMGLILSFWEGWSTRGSLPIIRSNPIAIYGAKYPNVWISKSFAIKASPVTSKTSIKFVFSWSNIFLKQRRTTKTLVKNTNNANTSTSLISYNVSAFATGNFQNSFPKHPIMK